MGGLDEGDKTDKRDKKSLEELFAVPVVVSVRLLDGAELPMTAEEAPAVRRAVAKRRRDFSFGRYCAHEALSELGSPVESLARRKDGSPDWPEGVVGAITHSPRWCAAVVAHRRDGLGLGLDIEDADRLSERASRLVLSDAEQAAASRHLLGGAIARTIQFSAKESIYKAVFPLVRRYVDFDEASVEIGPKGDLSLELSSKLRSELSRSARLVGRWSVSLEDSVVTAVTLRRD